MDIFSDKASLVLKQLLRHPEKTWVVRDFVRDLGMGRGWVAQILGELRKRGYLKGEPRGRNASSALRYEEELIQEWTNHYSFEQNRYRIYFSPEKDIFPKIKQFFIKSDLKESYALTLHAGANLITNFVMGSNIYLYLEPTHFEDLSLELRTRLNLKELKQGGNIYLICPYYKRSVFFGRQRIKGYNVVSNLQLYLDLYHFPERGREHAKYLLRTLKEKGERLGQ